MAAEEAASKAGELAQAVVLEHCSLAAKVAALAAVKLEHSVLKCTAAEAARCPRAWVQKSQTRTAAPGLDCLVSRNRRQVHVRVAL